MELRGLSREKNVRWTFFAGKHQLVLASDEPKGEKSERYTILSETELVLLKTSNTYGVRPNPVGVRFP